MVYLIYLINQILQFPLEVLQEHIGSVGVAEVGFPFTPQIMLHSIIPYNQNLQDVGVTSRKIGEQSRQLENVRTKRLSRATEVMKGMVVSADIREVRNKNELLNLLPVILDTQVGDICVFS